MLAVPRCVGCYTVWITTRPLCSGGKCCDCGRCGVDDEIEKLAREYVSRDSMVTEESLAYRRYVRDIVETFAVYRREHSQAWVFWRTIDRLRGERQV
jgi:hypothetical protein